MACYVLLVEVSNVKLSLRNSLDRYGSLQIILHWTTLLLVVALYVCIELRGQFPKGSNVREALKAWHFTLGLSVLILAIVRIGLQLYGPSPAIRPAPPGWQIAAGKVVHFALYAFMIGMPIIGWLLLSSEGKDIPFCGFNLPRLIGASKDLAEQLEELHETVGNIGYAMIGVHAAAALAHHYIARDNTLLRMLPRRN